jgi:soluble lytic murein transglycosylase-like protein
MSSDLRRDTIAVILSAAIMGVAMVQTAHGAGAALAQSGMPEPPLDPQMLDLTSIRRLYDALARQRTSPDQGERAASWADLSLLANAVVGDAPAGASGFGDLVSAAPRRPSPRLLATSDITARDTAAYQLLSLGYSAHETADVVSGRISKRVLDTAQRMLMAGRGHDAAANYLDREYKLAIALRNQAIERTDGGRAALSRQFDAAIEKYATLRNVGATLVRAIIVVESAFDPDARSPAGAVGLMQLMPATARELGVDPARPEENIEGGVRYLSELVKMFGGIELALVAYNGGPGFARRYARGLTPLYGETREYVRKVLTLARAAN